jgi:hypothetical protein
MTGSLTERYDDRIAGVLSCYDRVVVTGTLPTVCYAAGMTKFLYAIGVRIFDYPQFASTLRDRVRERAASLAAQAGITIEHIAKSHIRKEAVVAEVLKRRGEHPGLVHVISAMEACGAYQPWHDKRVAGTDKQGEKLDLTVRVTDVYKKISGNWLVIHEHVSVPVDLDTGKPDLTSKP